MLRGHRPHLPTVGLVTALASSQVGAEVFGRLAVDGVPMPVNSHLPTLPWERCACGAAEAEASPRMHHFWACPIAVGLRSVVEDRCCAGGALGLVSKHSDPVAKSHVQVRITANHSDVCKPLTLVSCDMHVVPQHANRSGMLYHGP